MPYPCPFLGTEKELEHCRRPAQTLRGFKKHMTRNHGGWTSQQIADATVSDQEPAKQPTPKEKEDFFTEPGAQTVHETAPATEVREPKPRMDSKARKASKELTEALDGFKSDFVSMLPAMTVGFFESKLGIAGTLTEKATKSVCRLWDAYITMLGFEIETDTEPTKVKVKGKWLKLFMPVAIVGYTFTLMVGKRKVEKEPEPAPAPAPLLVPEPPKHEETIP